MIAIVGRLFCKLKQLIKLAPVRFRSLYLLSSQPPFVKIHWRLKYKDIQFFYINETATLEEKKWRIIINTKIWTKLKNRFERFCIKEFAFVKINPRRNLLLNHISNRFHIHYARSHTLLIFSPTDMHQMDLIWRQKWIISVRIL